MYFPISLTSRRFGAEFSNAKNVKRTTAFNNTSTYCDLLPCPVGQRSLVAPGISSRFCSAVLYIVSKADFWRRKKMVTNHTSHRRLERCIGTGVAAKTIQERSRSGRVKVSYWGWMWVTGQGHRPGSTKESLSGTIYQFCNNVTLSTVRVMTIRDRNE